MMKTTSIRLLFTAVLLAAACGGDDSTTTDSSITVDGSADTGGGEGGTPDGGGGDAAADGSASDAATGCAMGAPCPSGQMCCSGVPYPPEGECMEECTMRSDRDAKERFEAVDAHEMLARLSRLPVREWSYRDEAGEVRHVGPMAQDFHASFGLGGDDRTIHPVDASGVTIAAIQALAERVDDLERDNAALRAHVLELEAAAQAR